MSIASQPAGAGPKPIITEHWIKELEEYLATADFDGAISVVAGLDPSRLDDEIEDGLSDLLKLRARCLICEVYDYAGKNKEANLCIARCGEDAKSELESAAVDTAEIWTDNNPEHFQKLKQECLTCLHFGMVTYYRKHQYLKALNIFTLAWDILEKIDRRTSMPCKGSLAHALYFIGLAEREQYNFYDARKYFSEAIELAWKRIQEEQQQGGGRVGFLKYIVGRSLGLGMAWMAFVRASMSEAKAHISAARMILQDCKGVSYLRDYVEVLQACTQRSRATTIADIHAAIQAMKSTYNLLGGDNVLKSGLQPLSARGEGNPGHFLYAQRTACELATSHIYAARLHGRAGQQFKAANDEVKATQKINERDAHLQEAAVYLRLIDETLSLTDPDRADLRTRCNVLIAKSRIAREKNDLPEALAMADRAVRMAGTNPFSRIDCWTNFGEACFSNGEIERALQFFRKARNDRHAQMNPKVLAVCDLHTALCHLKLKEFRLAEEIVARWKSQGSLGRANAFVQYLQEEIDSQLSQQAFFIPGDTPNLDMDYWLDAVKTWLEQAALKRTQGVEAKALELINRKTMRKTKAKNGSTDSGDTPTAE